MKYLALPALALLMSAVPAQSQTRHWAFADLKRPPVPRCSHATWVRNPIDAFVLRKLEQRNLTPAPPADRAAVLRRLTYDLTGLPPTPAEVTAFTRDPAPRAFEAAVDRLLASPRFGERWAQHWLDVVRFGESNGYEHDLDRPQAWRYRDWVVGALNADVPYDEFVRLQVAGDLIHPGDFDSRVATGFLRTGPFHITGGNLDPVEMRQEWLTEAVGGIGSAILGLTINCARCHDHKFDPIPQADYYRFQAFFAGTANRDEPRATDEEKKRVEAAAKEIKARTAPIEARIAAIEKPYRDSIRAQKRARLAPEYAAALAVDPTKRTAAQKKLAGEAQTHLNISWDEVVAALAQKDREERAALRRQMFAIEEAMPPPVPEAQGVGDVVQPVPATHVLVRGDVHAPGPEVKPDFPSCIGADSVASASSENPRLALARWLTSPRNALTSRVMVNRVWQCLFGRGLVATPNDFGRHGQPPTHPELLDWLATEFSRPITNTGGAEGSGCGWSVKRLIRLMVTSATYRQACRYDAAMARVDPDNRLLWRMNRKRLDAEALRDSILAAAGTLNLQAGGPSVRVPLEPEVYDTIFTEAEPDNLWPATPDVRQHSRRSIYLFRKRNVRLPMLALFDQPDMMSPCGARGQTVHALQSLALLNSDFMQRQSILLARRLEAEAPSSDRARLDRLFLLTVGRLPRADELRASVRFLRDQTALLARAGARGAAAAPHDTVVPVSSQPTHGAATSQQPSQAGKSAARQALADLCLATLNMNEFIYVR